jgi:hypothetical protein
MNGEKNYRRIYVYDEPALNSIRIRDHEVQIVHANISLSLNSAVANSVLSTKSRTVCLQDFSWLDYQVKKDFSAKQNVEKNCVAKTAFW